MKSVTRLNVVGLLTKTGVDTVALLLGETIITVDAVVHLLVEGMIVVMLDLLISLKVVRMKAD